MADMRENLPVLGGAVLVAGAAYYGYKKFYGKKAEAVQSQEDSTGAANKNNEGATTLLSYNGKPLLEVSTKNPAAESKHEEQTKESVATPSAPQASTAVTNVPATVAPTVEENKSWLPTIKLPDFPISKVSPAQPAQTASVVEDDVDIYFTNFANILVSVDGYPFEL